MLRTLIEAGSSVQVTDDYGRTPLHDACWTSSTDFDTIKLLLDQDPWLLSIMDCRGSTPLGYVRKASWAVWIGFLNAVADRYWPHLDNNSQGDHQLSCQVSSERHDIPPLALEEPNSRPLPNPQENTLKLELVELLANGKLTPQDLESQDAFKSAKACQVQENIHSALQHHVSRITLDPMREKGSNATTMKV